MNIGRNAPCPCGSGKKYKQCCASEQKKWAATPVRKTQSLSVEQMFQHAAQEFSSGRLAAAEALCRQALQRQPRNAALLNLLGMVEYQNGRHDKAILLMEQAIRLVPENAFFHSNLGNVLQRLQRFDEAEQHFRRATALRPDIAEFQYNLGNTLQYRGEDRAAMECHRRALELKPEYANAHCNLSMLLRAAGDLAAGWAHNAYRFQREISPILMRPFPHPFWQGEPLTGKTLLVWGEQGVGDEILFASVLPDVIRAAKRVI
ncbi:MAG: tetratricopeptide repeat protein, partial [Sulfuricella denitrificans]|nr:tetratricopeptide repeat protein [Sulfuricella denitrificans]